MIAPGVFSGAGVLGVGVDLCDIRRIEDSITRFGDRFLGRIYTDQERHDCDSRGRGRIAAYARRWAAKEACAKALGTGAAQGVSLRDIEVERLAGGAPSLRLWGGAAARLARMTPKDCAARLHVSLTDEPPYAQAFVVIEASKPRC